LFEIFIVKNVSSTQVSIFLYIRKRRPQKKRRSELAREASGSLTRGADTTILEKAERDAGSKYEPLN